MTVALARAPHVALRALVATVLIMLGATSAHTWAGGHLPALPGLLLLAGVVLAGGLLFLRGVVRWRTLLPAVVVAQTGLHGMFGLLATDPAHAGHLGQGGSAMSMAEPTQWTWQMFVAHAVSTVLTVAVWWLCDRAVHAMVSLLDLRSPYVAGRRDARLAGRPRPAVPSLVPLSVAPRRGPPAVLCGT